MSQKVIEQGILRLKPTTNLIATKVEYYQKVWSFDGVDKSRLVGIEIDMSQVSVMDSSGIGLILSVFKECDEVKKIEFRLINCSEDIKQLIGIVGLDKILLGAK